MPGMDRAAGLVSELFEARRDRRALMRWGVAASGAAAIAAVQGYSPAGAQDATPEPVADEVRTMFVQAFHNGNWEPGPEDGTYTLILHGGLASTIYFSDRPDRVFGAAPTDSFLATMGFEAENPPNAALVVDSDGVADILVVELMDPVYDDAAQNLVYTARVLEAYHETGLEYLAVQQADDSLPQEFGAGALFIDDCDDANGWCQVDDKVITESMRPWGQCYSYPFCSNCRDYDRECNQLYPAQCGGRCKYRQERGGGCASPDGTVSIICA